ncbi:hypothetical protein [Bradyrhizobium sp. sGM-13]|uniref:hypothetical protein n=1 Tax=Bradyrhizobium sp. sGM-13 TaxID=2831781 RepID=UPI001BCFA9D3|nr:hypothetical protein [Bradyrhizobium sp. sGM-13]
MAEKPKPPTTWLVWVQGLKGPNPQLWYDDGGRFVGPSEIVVLQRNELPSPQSEFHLDTLATLYPLEQEAA